jgi:hypothetical protein
VKKIALLQSNYIPWKGYFDLIKTVDEVVIYDDAQYTKRDWRNRNLIRTKEGVRWLTIPVEVKGRFDQKICETKVAHKNWAEKHYESIRHSYSKAPYFNDYSELLMTAYYKCSQFEMLSVINRYFIDFIISFFGINARLTNSSDYDLKGNRNEKIIAICKQAGADKYVSGPAAKSYIDTSLFSESGIEVIWYDYSGYREYKQVFLPFIPGVSIIDLILNTGPDAKLFMKIN